MFCWPSALDGQALRQVIQHLQHVLAFLAAAGGGAAGETVPLHAQAAGLLDEPGQLRQEAGDLLTERAVGNLPKGQDDLPLLSAEGGLDGDIRQGCLRVVGVGSEKQN